MAGTLLQSNIGRQGKVGASAKECTNDGPSAVAALLPVSRIEGACCLFWMAGSSMHADEALLLHGVHAMMAESVRQVGGKTLEDNATSGLVRFTPQERNGMSAEDAAVRLGQLLCQWARAQRPPMRLRIGVHTGDLESFELPSTNRFVYAGVVVDTCRSLALGSECESTVHLSATARTGLRALGGERLRLSRRGGSYYTEAAVAEARVPTDKARQQSLAQLVSEHFVPNPAGENGQVVVPATTLDTSSAGVLGMLFRDFRKLLQDHGVRVEDFGMGDAKTLREFYNDAVIERDSSLQVIDGKVQRFKEVIRIQLLTRGDDNRLRELRIDSQGRADGSFRKRNEVLAAVLRAREGQRWKEALPQFFEEKFGLNKADQTSCLSVEWDSYKYTEEQQTSMTIPGITTTYKVHNVTVSVRDQNRPELARIGLPGGTDFSTDKLTGEHRWKWVSVGGAQEDALLKKLAKVRIALTPTAFSELSDEIHVSCQASLEVENRQDVLRKVKIIKVWLHADILAADHVLLLDSKIQRGRSDEADKGRPLTMRMLRGQTWQKAVETLLHKRLGITPETQLSCIAVDPATRREFEERAESRSYPGVQTAYQIDEVTARVVMNEVDAATLHRIGLPDGQNFSFSRWEPARGPGNGDMIIMHWTWQSSKDITSKKVRRAPSLTDKHSEAWWAEVREKRRHLLVPELDGGMQGGIKGVATGSWFAFGGSSNTVLETLMKGRRMDMKRARRAAREICNPSYSCKDFYEDITAAFPELNLYLVGDMTSGRAGEDEYQRTLGAMFCFFWLMRLHLDGSQSFCFGLDESWKSRAKPFDDSQQAQDEWDRRSAFHRDAEWASLEQLLVNAGLLEEAAAGAGDFSRKRSYLALASKKAKDTRRHDEDRTLAMLVLTAIHDIMKTVQLLPTVSRKHVSGSFRGYKVGEVINDHDAALAYVLEFSPSSLPSFAALPKEQQESVKFTQSKMEYNMGWLVQAEAPPGALFRKLRRVVSSGQASPRDLAFYFTHWFTDLAGAEPFPQEGCEKFVLKFPKAVLNQFLLSFNIVQNIGLPGATETRVYEEYLTWRWDSHKPSLGPAPHGKGAIAKMRLVTMAQGDSHAVLEAFDALHEADKEVLTDELSNVDIWNQSWVREESEHKGPAILVYYAPALMQKAGQEDPSRALTLLAEVFRQARSLWPLSEEARSWWVSVRVDQLKELPLAEVESPRDGKVWVMAKLTSREGAIQLTPKSEVGNRAEWATSNAVLNIGRQQLASHPPTPSNNVQ